MSFASLTLPDVPWLAPLAEVIIIGAFVLLAVFFHKVIVPLLIRFTQWTPTDADTRVVIALRPPVTIAIVVVGIYLAIVVPRELNEPTRCLVNNATFVVAVALAAHALARVLSAVLGWYMEHVAPRTRSDVDERILPPMRRILVVLVYGMAVLLVLGHLHVNISPLLAGLGLGGLAVALAIQPTLANLFAGTYVMTEGAVSPGDFIELEGGVAGYVTEVSWRSTRIRTRNNNLVVVPNARLADTIITNYQLPDPVVNVVVNCGVSYDSDLEQVEQVCKEVMQQVVESSADAVQESLYYFGLDEFGDSNVNFWLMVQAKDRASTFALKSRLIQSLHGRFKQEGIVINYPVRTLQLPAEWKDAAYNGLTARTANDVNKQEQGQGPLP
ncbi:MAG: mechanosensitive ion channel family protein [SAR202 cluster bacterium]|nr:mechanosensitive ion channel family protein [SAR202 cluster bacterium]